MAEPFDVRVNIGHLHLKVADLDRALAFYRDVLGFQFTQRMGSQAAFLGAGGYHHHLGLNTWESRGGAPPPPGSSTPSSQEIRNPIRKINALPSNWCPVPFSLSAPASDRAAA